MTNKSIQQVSPSSGALSAEHYQTFEMAKANDGILGGDDIAQIRSYAAFARAQAQAIHKSIATMGELDDVAQAKAEMTETSQTFAKVSVYADQRIGEILRELPKSNKWKSNSDAQEVETKADALKEANISKSQAYDLQSMAANPDVVEAVIAKAEAEGRIVSRSQVLKAIKERDAANEALEDAYRAQEAMEDELESLRNQPKPKPEVIEHEVVREVEVVPDDYEQLKRRNEDLKREADRLNREYQEMWQKKRDADKRLEQANELLGEKKRNHEATRDIEQLTIATNSYLRNYGGKAWAFDQFDRVDEITQREFEKAITSMASFAQNLMAMIQDRKQLGA